jgi:hypothetical protein
MFKPQRYAQLIKNQSITLILLLSENMNIIIGKVVK